MRKCLKLNFTAIQAKVALIIPKDTVWWVCTDDLHSKKDSSPEESVRFNPLHSCCSASAAVIPSIILSL